MGITINKGAYRKDEGTIKKDFSCCTDVGHGLLSLCKIIIILTIMKKYERL
jgi:hypothetical protein